MRFVEDILELKGEDPKRVRTGNRSAITLIVLMISAVAIGVYFFLDYTGLLPHQYLNDEEPPAVQTPIVAPIVAAKDSDAEQVLTQIMDAAPVELDKLKTAAVGPDFAQTLPGLKDCTGLVPIAPSVSAVKGWSGGNWIKPQGITITINAYPAGLGHDALMQLTDNACSWLNVTTESNKVNGSVRNGNEVTNFVSWRNGDVITTVTATNHDLPTSFIEQMQTKLPEALAPACVNPAEIEDTSSRNPYYSADGFTGLLASETVDAVGDLPAERKQPNVAELPELVLPQQPDFPFYPASLPVAVDRPQAPTVPAYPAIQETIQYRVPDEKGPGCGWEFTGMTAPAFNAEKEDEAHAASVKDAQDRMTANLNTYVTDVSNWQTKWEQYEKDSSAFLQYKWDVDEVAVQWNEQRTAQDTYRNNMTAYNNSVDAYNSFNSRQQEAQRTYDNTVTTCEQYATATASPTTTWVTPEPTTEVRTITPSPTPPAPTGPPSDSTSPTEAPEQPEPTPYETTVTVQPTPYPTTVLVQPTPPHACPPARPAILDENPPTILDKPTPPPDPRPEGER